jgi:beta-lactamase regulating signal transducer with metallopeptidase domain
MKNDLGWARMLGWLVNHSLQAGLLVLIVLAVQWAFRRQLTARWRFALWWIVLARLLLPFNPQSAVSLFNLVQPAVPLERVSAQPVPDKTAGLERRGLPPETAPDSPASLGLPLAVNVPPPVAVVLPAAASPRWPNHPPTKTAWWVYEYVFPGLAGLWGAGVLALSGLVLVQLLRFNQKLNRAAMAPNHVLQNFLDDCRAEFGVTRPVELLETAAVQSPALFGLLRLRLLLPRGMAERFTRAELRFVFLHELAHVKRGDLWGNWLVTGLQILHWFNPLVWLGFARLRADRELACDELALLRAGDQASTAYGETVVKLLESLSRPAAIPGLVGILEDRKQMRRRIFMIANFRRPGRASMLAGLLLAVVAAAALTDAQSSRPGPGEARLKVGNDASMPTNSPEGFASYLSEANNVAGSLDPNRQPVDPPRPTVTNGPVMNVLVLDDATGQPLAGAEVLAPNQSAFQGGRENAPRWLTEPSGTARIHLGESSSNTIWHLSWFTLSVRKPGYASSGMSWSAGNGDVRPGLPGDITLRLKRGTTAGGVVVDEAGVPQAGLQVRVFGSGYSYANFQELHQSYAEFWNDATGSLLPVTDQAGHWQVKDFPVLLPNVAVEFIRPDGSREKFRYPGEADNVNEPQGAPLDLAALLAGEARFVLKAGYELHGLVVDSRGQPLPGVRIQTGYGMGNIELAGAVRSDAGGHFVLAHLHHRQVILTADATGHAITSLIVDLPSNQPEVRLPMADLAPLQIHVRDGGGQPVVGASVTAGAYPTEGQLLDFAGATDSQGNLIWTNAPVSECSLVATAPRSTLSQKIRRTPEQREVTFHLRAGMDKSIIVHARVRDAQTGLPVKLGSARYQSGDREGFKWSADVLATGFHLELPASRFRSGMYPSFQMQLKAEGYATLTTPWRDFDEGDWDASFTMESASAAQGTVTLADGSPASGARLWTRTEDVAGTLFINRPDTYYGDRMIKIQTDAQGRFILPEVPEDQPMTFTHSNGFLSVPAAAVKRNHNVRLQPWGRVAGVLKIGGQTKGGVSVDLAQLQWFQKMDYTLTYSTTTGPDGSFAFEHVPAGEYKLYRHRTKTGIVTEDHPMPLVVKPGETTTLDYSNPGRAVIGQAVPSDPQLVVDWLHDDNTLTLKLPPLAAERVSFIDYATEKAFQAANNDSFQKPEFLNQARAARTYVLAFEPDGSFRAEDIPPGTYELKIAVTKPDPQNQFQAFNQSRDVLASLTREVVVPAGETPFDLGTLPVTIKGGDGKKPSPPLNFTATKLDGQTVRLDQFRGQYVVLAFWALWSDRSPDGLKGCQHCKPVSTRTRAWLFSASIWMTMPGRSPRPSRTGVIHGPRR